MRARRGNVALWSCNNPYYLLTNLRKPSYNPLSHLLGAIAQLGERLHGMQEVAGSIPASSKSEYLVPIV